MPSKALVPTYDVSAPPAKLNLFDRAILALFPTWGLSRVRARVLARHFEAASVGRRTAGWSRKMTDANAASAGATLGYLRAQARDLVRNNPWARRGLNRIVKNTVGWGIKPKATGRNAKKVAAAWKLWAETTQCDAAGRLTFYGLQRLVMHTIVESGEVLIRRRYRRPEDGLAIPMQLQVIEPDYIDTGKHNVPGLNGVGEVVQGVEFDAIGRRVAYWLFDRHPGGAGMTTPVSKRIPSDGILHVYDQERAGQVRGVPWFASVDVRLHDFDEFEDATLMKQKIAACLAAFVTDMEGSGTGIGATSTDDSTGQNIDSLEPGMILTLPPGRQVTTTNPPAANDHQAYSTTALRGVAAGLGTTYEDLTGDYSQVNYSSARMARLAHYSDVDDWRWNMLIPQFCMPAWQWMLDALVFVGVDADGPAKWTPPPTPMLDPDKEGLANSRMIRAGQKTLSEMIREQGYDPDEFLAEYAADMKMLDKLGLILDSDARKTTAAGQAQVVAASPTAPAAPTTDSTDSSADKPPA